MNRVLKMIAVCVVAVAAAVSVNSQTMEPVAAEQQTPAQTPTQTPAQTPTQTTTTQTTTQQTTTQQTTTQEYVFPSGRERFNRYMKSSFGPFRLGYSAFTAGINQWRDHPDEWEQGMSGYGKRYASTLGQNFVQQTVTYTLDMALGQDTGFEKSKREGFGPRLKDALLQNVTSRTRSGNRVVSVPRFVGVYTGAIVSRETWYPNRYDYKDGLKSGTYQLLTGFGINVVREFLFNW